tara:strand:- start:252 stop:431 length:180 start_codon:yes stop_codon:yes gene_type:complete
MANCSWMVNLSKSSGFEDFSLEKIILPLDVMIALSLFPLAIQCYHRAKEAIDKAVIEFF